MRVAQYADWCTEDHMYQPHTYPEDVVAYPGTHDTNTVVGYHEAMDDQQRDCMHYYLDTDGHEIHWDLISSVWGSDAETAIVPLQDVLGLGADARFNTPGTLDGNWAWRVTEAGLADDLADRLRGVTEHFGRLRK
jgi:4-alpha-glucanotransferase